MSASVSYKVLILDEDAGHQAFFNLFFKQHGLDIVFVKNESETINALNNQPFSLLIIDIMSKNLNGRKSLKNLSQITNHSLPLMVISHIDAKETISDCIKHGASHFIPKPIDVEYFSHSINEILFLAPDSADTKVDKSSGEKKLEERSLIEELAHRLKHDKLDFSAMPELGHKIIEMLNDDKSSLKKVADFIEKDPGIFSRILKAANSVAFNAGKLVYTPDAAIQRIGVRRTSNYILALSSVKLFKNPNPAYEDLLKGILEHSFTTAICAREIGQNIKDPYADHYFAFGLLHDIGKVLLLRILNVVAKERELNDEESILLILKKYHMNFGASLMRKWHFPEDFIEAILFQENSTGLMKLKKSTLITSLANTIVESIENGTLGKQKREILKYPHVKLIGFRPSNLDQLVKRVHNEKELLLKLIES